MEKMFNKAFYEATEVTFNDSWNNGTGYYDYACYDPLLEVNTGQFFKTIDPNTNRRIIGLKIREGRNHIIFERFSKGVNTPFILVNNLPRCSLPKGENRFLFTSSVSEEALTKFLKKELVYDGGELSLDE